MTAASSFGASMLRQILFMAMELCWIGGLLLLIGLHVGGRSDAVFPFAAVLYPVAYAVGLLLRPSTAHPWSPLVAGTVAGIVMTGGLTAALLPVQVSWGDPAAAGWSATDAASALLPAVSFAACAGLAWLRGWVLSRRRIDAGGFASGFQNGLVVLLLVLVLAAGVPGAGIMAAWMVILFLALALLGLWHVRAGSGTGSRGAGFAMLGLLAVLLLGAVFWALVDRALLDAAVDGLRWIAGGIGRAFAWLAGYLPGVESPAQAPLAAPGGGPVDDRPFSLPEAVRTVARALFMPLIGGFLAIALFRSLFDLLRWLRRRPDGIAVQYERSTAGWLDTLGALARWLLARLPRRRGDVATANPLRAAYRQFLERLARRGWRRAEAETPDEFRRRLLPAWPGRAADVAVLTAAYEATRYGPPDAPATVPGETWRRLRGEFRKVKRIHG